MTELYKCCFMVIIAKGQASVVVGSSSCMICSHFTTKLSTISAHKFACDIFLSPVSLSFPSFLLIFSLCPPRPEWEEVCLNARWCRITFPLCSFDSGLNKPSVFLLEKMYSVAPIGFQTLCAPVSFYFTTAGTVFIGILLNRRYSAT